MIVDNDDDDGRFWVVVPMIIDIRVVLDDNNGIVPDMLVVSGVNTDHPKRITQCWPLLFSRLSCERNRRGHETES